MEHSWTPSTSGKIGEDHHVVSDNPGGPTTGSDHPPGWGGLQEVVESVWAVAIASLFGFWLIRMFVEANSSWRCPSVLFGVLSRSRRRSSRWCRLFG